MKEIFGTTAILVAMTAATTAQAQGINGDWYASVFGGYSFPSSLDNDATDNYSGYDEVIFFVEQEEGLVLGAAIGLEVSPGLRAEVEISYASYELGDYGVEYSPGSPGEETYGDVPGDATATYLMANVWYDVSDMGGDSYTPYVGGGIGGVAYDIEDGDDGTALAFQLGVGAQFGAIDVGYRFKMTGELDDIGDGLEPVTSHNLQVGYVMKF